MLWKVLRIMLSIIILAWVVLVLIDFYNVQTKQQPKFCIKEETHKYSDGTVYECTGLGYKVFKYNRKSFSAVEFGPFFIKERESAK